jgi:hypothetical protein
MGCELLLFIGGKAQEPRCLPMMASKIVVRIFWWLERTSAGADRSRFLTSSGACAMMVLHFMLPVTRSFDANS